MDSEDVVLVGPCAAGKSTLAHGLREQGFRVQPVAQEHSGVRSLWRRHSTHALVYLDVDLANVHQRGRPAFPGWLHETQRERLRDARDAADLYLDTSPLSIPDVLSTVLEYLARQQIHPRA
ncbi:MAG TPA: hypothetical protein VGE07_08150, partial [Herpetosiphonaceae bacterium]